MNKLTHLILVLLLCGSSSLFARQTERQDSEPTAAKESSPSQETEISEDNYRRFMELKDQPVERAMPILQAPAPPGLENMQRLPESSQKHLRDQLRENILRSGPWTAASVDEEYPFVPSEAARGDRSLMQNEGLAWEELVSQYHEREAAFEAARNQRSGKPAGAGTQNQNSSSQAGAGQASAQNLEQDSAKGSAQDSEQGAAQAGASNDGQPQSQQARERAQRTAQAQRQSQQRRMQSQRPVEGSEQSALEFLTGKSMPSAATTPGNNVAEQAGQSNTNTRTRGVLTLNELEQAKGITVIGSVGETEAEPEPEPESDQTPSSAK